MKIMKVIPYFTPKLGGSFAVLYNLSLNLAKKGHDVTVITTNFNLNHEAVTSLENEGIEVIVFNCDINFSLFLISYNMDKWIKNNIHRFDIVHIHGYRSYPEILICKYSKMYGVPYILQTHGCLCDLFKKKLLKKGYDFLFGYKNLNNSSKVVVLNNTEKKQHIKVGINEKLIKTIPNGINTDEYDNLPKKNEFKKKYGIKNNEKVILYLGRIDKVKGIDFLIRAFFRISKIYNDVKLVIIGPDWGFLPNLKFQVTELELNEKVLFIGPLYGKDKLKAYVDSDVYVLPSIYEIFPLTVLEACACEVPVIVTNKCGIADTIKNNKLGYVVRTEEHQLVSAINTFLNDEKLRRKVGERNRKLVKKSFSWDHVTKKFEELYISVVK